MSRECPNLSETDYFFWEMQWYKHGTCSPYSSCESYFQFALDLRSKVKLTVELLKEEGIKPKHKKLYKTDKFLEAMERITSVRPKVHCKQNSPKHDYKDILWELRFCVDLYGQFYDCPYPKVYCDYRFRWPVAVV